jgi:hypothetical protein
VPRIGGILAGQFAGTFYRLVQDLGRENNTVPVMTITSVSRTPILSVLKDFNRATEGIRTLDSDFVSIGERVMRGSYSGRISSIAW